MVSVYATTIFIVLALLMLIKRTSGRVKVWLKKISKFLMFIFFAEIVSLIGLFVISGEWLFEERENFNAALFEEDPYLIATNKKNVSARIHGITYTHDSLGYRITPEKKSKKKILTIGGSTTYGTNVSDQHTWPYILDNLLGEEYDVLNLAVPGHSTVQHVIMSSMSVKSMNPDLIIYHIGLNDLRNSHVDTIDNDYAYFHSPTMFGAMGLCYREKWPRIALARLMVMFLQEVNLYPVCLFHSSEFSGQTNENFDKRVVKVYQQNLQSLANINHYDGTKGLFIPQILPPGNISEGNYAWWIPYIPDHHVSQHMDYFNLMTYYFANAVELDYLSEVDSAEWSQDLFADPSHLNEQGNNKLAKLIYQKIKKMEVKN